MPFHLVGVACTIAYGTFRCEWNPTSAEPPPRPLPDVLRWRCGSPSQRVCIVCVSTPPPSPSCKSLTVGEVMMMMVVVFFAVRCYCGSSLNPDVNNDGETRCIEMRVHLSRAKNLLFVRWLLGCSSTWATSDEYGGFFGTPREKRGLIKRSSSYLCTCARCTGSDIAI